ncbi:MAG: hydroxymethylbilane synthase [Actinobacteria bacterium]|nr:hydroxymethylbilane synthase [Actinomycetota bacterium]
MTDTLRVATRGSELARLQAGRVVDLLAVPAELVVVSTRGDRDKTSPIHAIGGAGVFAKEVQEAVLQGDADVAVHSAKDLPAVTPYGLTIGAVPERADPRDVLVGSRLDDLPTGSLVGTGAVRRRAQLASLRPDLAFGELRGNIATRLAQADRFGAIVVALAALERLGLTERATEVCSTSTLLPQVGQGALAVECRADDQATLDALATVDDALSHAELRAERAYLAQLGGGCDLPCGALARADGDGSLDLEVMLASLDGHVVLRLRGNGDDPEALGSDLARRLVDHHGGNLLLEEAEAL